MIACFIFLLALKSAFSLSGDYYWREYSGEIPHDAIVGGKDSADKNVYIGQAYLKGEGLIVSAINDDIKEVEVAHGGVKKIDSNIKVLCGVQKDFYWKNVNATDLHVQLADKKPVIGGQQNEGVLYIGRLYYEGSVQIGKVAAFTIGNANMFFAYKGKEVHVSSYQVLLCKKNVDVKKKKKNDN